MPLLMVRSLAIWKIQTSVALPVSVTSVGIEEAGAPLVDARREGHPADVAGAQLGDVGRARPRRR